MKEFKFKYKDVNGRTNIASRFAKDEYEATEKFKLLYPNTFILDIN